MILRCLRIPVTLFCLFTSLTATFAQATFQKYMVTADTLSEGYCIAGLSNGNMAIGGSYADNLTSGNVDGMIYMLTEAGDKVWSLRLGGPNSGESVADMAPLSDGGLLVSYYAYANNELLNSFLIRVNNLGGIVWSKIISENTDIFGTTFTKVSGGYIVSGFTGGGSSSALIKIDLDGNIIWSKTYEGMAVGSNAIAEDNTGNLHVVGRLFSSGTWMKLKGSDGSLLSAKNFTGANLLTLEICKVLTSDSLLMVGHDYSNGFVLLKTDYNANPGTVKRYTYGNGTLYPLYVHAPGNGEFTLPVFQSGGSGTSGILTQFNSKLEPQWAKSYATNTNATSNFFDMNAVANGLVMTGTYRLNNQEKALLVKTDFEGNVFGKCCPKDITLNAANGSATTNNLLVNETIPFTLENQPTQYNFINVTPTPLCITNENINISDTLVCPGQCVTVLLGGSEPGITYTWALTGGSPATSNAVNPGKVCYNGEGSYPITVSANNCLLDSVSLTVDNVPDRFPNAFSPNGDNVNEVFRPLIDCPIEEYRLQVFNRWGDLIFETYDLNEGWNGEANGEQSPVDVYVYRVEFYAVRDGVKTLVFNEMKEVTLVR